MRKNHYHEEMLSVEEARKKILENFSILPSEDKLILDSLGQILSENITAKFPIPPLDNSAMDGYAVVSGDTIGATNNQPVKLKVIGSIAAGYVPTKKIESGQSMRIMTGAPIPKGADAVIPFEETDEKIRNNFDYIGCNSEVKKGDNIRLSGEDVLEGKQILSSGIVINDAHVGVIASLGKSKIKVIKKPVISIISTGDEILEPGEKIKPGKIYNSNAYSIASMVKSNGGIPNIVGTASDSEESLNMLLDKAYNSDFIVTSAGVSKGDYDVVKDVLFKRGKIKLWSVRMRPAKPLAFGVLDIKGKNIPHLGLPGNPVSAMIAFEQFGIPAIKLMMGKKDILKSSFKIIIDDEIINYDHRRVYARVLVFKGEDGKLHANLTGNQSSGVLTSMSKANALAICPEDREKINIGEEINAIFLDDIDDLFF